MSKRRQNFQNISWFYDLYKRKLLDLDPPFQRRSVWNQTYRELFIDTILLDHPAPAIFLFGKIEMTGSTTYQVVDGKQRLTTIFDFLANKFPVSEQSEVNALKGVYFESLPPEMKIAFYEYDFSVEYLPTNDEQGINKIFDRLNRNVAKLTAQELRHARFNGEFISSAEELADWMQTHLPQFPHLTPMSKRQMKDVELVSILLLFLEEGTKGFSSLALDEAYSSRDKEWETRTDTVDKFRKTLEAIQKLIHGDYGQHIIGSRLRNQADFYSLFGAYAELLEDNAVPADGDLIASRLLEFLQAVEDENGRVQLKAAQAYYDAVRSASNDSTPRRIRVDILKKVILGTPLEPAEPA